MPFSEVAYTDFDSRLHGHHVRKGNLLRAKFASARYLSTGLFSTKRGQNVVIYAPLVGKPCCAWDVLRWRHSLDGAIHCMAPCLYFLLRRFFRPAGEDAGIDISDYWSFCRVVIRDVFPVLEGDLAFCRRVEVAVFGMFAQPIAE